jgi:Protein of unknown function (DUF669)
MRFDPQTDEQLATMDLMEEGIYPCEVVTASDKVSRSGNEMIELKLRVWDQRGRERLIFDYLLPQMAKKLKHFAVAAGLADKYEMGTISSEDCVGKQMSVEISIQAGKQKPDGSGDYPPKNSVKDYSASSSSGVDVKPRAAEPVSELNPPFDDSDIPF